MSSLLRAFGVVLITAGLALVVYIAGPWPADAPEAGPTRPIERRERSLLLVTLDTTRADHLQPYGAEDVETPNLQRLAREGVVFEHAYSVSPITLVAHTSLLSGLYPPRHGVRNNGIHYVAEEIETLAERLRDRAYRTAAFVSAAVLQRRYGLDQGFEVFDDDLSRGRERFPRMVPDRPAEATVDAALAWLDQTPTDERFFLWVHFYDPHAAYSPPPPYRDRYRERLYDGEIAYMDVELGRLLEHPRLSHGDEPLVMVVGDHGESLGEHGEQTHAILAYDATLHVPWILRVPGGPKGLRIPVPVSQVDVTPTALDLLGRDAAGFDGRSRVAAIEGSRRRDTKQPGLYSEAYLAYYTYGWEKLHVLRRGPWKYIEAPNPELYDTRRDPGELSNLADQQPGRAHDLGRDLKELLDSAGGAERASELALDNDALESLRALGYVAVGQSAPERAERPDPKDVVGLHVGLERARRLSHDRLWEQAAQQIQAVLRKDANNLAALMAQARNQLQRKQHKEARATAERALGLDPDNAQLHLLVASVEVQQGRREQALTVLEAALKIDPRLVEAHLQRARILAQLRRLDEAQSVVRMALAQEPESARAMTAHAELVEMRRGDWPAAERRLRQALERDPFLAEAWLALGESQTRMGRSNEALATYRDGLKRRPDSHAFHGHIGLLLARAGGGAETAVHLREAIRLAPVFRPELHVALGGWLAEHHRLEDAQKEYARVLAIHPKHPGARNNRAVALYRTGRRQEAKAELLRLVEEFAQHVDAHNNLAAIAVEEEDWATAVKHARKTLDMDATLPEAWNNLGVAQEEQGQLQVALQSYDRALALEGGYWQARFNRGLALAKLGRKLQAIAEMQHVVQRAPGYPASHFELGRLLADSDPDLARRHLNAFLRAAPGDSRAPTARSLLIGLAGDSAAAGSGG